MSYQQFDIGIPAKDVRSSIARQRSQERALLMHDRWQESERILDILRSIPAQKPKPTREVMAKWQARIAI